jgi:DNA-binding CsgD family transcriptional regulator
MTEASHKTDTQRSQIAQFRSLVDSLGTRHFGRSFFAFLRTFIDIDDCTVFVLPRDDNPMWLIAEGKNNRAVAARQAAEQYVSDFYPRDPNIDTLRDALCGRATALRFVHRDSIRDSDYRARFYDEIDIREKVAVLTRFDGGHLYSNFYRSASHEHFDDAQIAVVRQISRLTLSCLKKHLKFIGRLPKGRDRESKLRAVYRLLTKREGARLTEREADVCARIILGMSTTGIALDLRISDNTVATLRKRAYDRLGISSQNELFAFCLEDMIGSPSKE